MIAAEGEAEQAGGAATWMKYLKNPMKELSGRKRRLYNLNPPLSLWVDRYVKRLQEGHLKWKNPSTMSLASALTVGQNPINDKDTDGGQHNAVDGQSLHQVEDESRQQPNIRS